MSRPRPDDVRAEVGRGDGRPRGGGVNGYRCYATVLLDEELWQSLAAVSGAHHAAWVHGCALDHGHRGDHQAPAARAGALRYWLRWGDTGRARIDTSEQPHPPDEPRRQPRPVPSPTTAAHAVATPPGEPAGSPTAGSQAEALWAIAAAIERLADVIAAAGSPTAPTGRHRKHAYLEYAERRGSLGLP